MSNTKTICVVNNKGGVGKTTTVSCLSEVLASLGKQVLVVDTDPQGNTSQLITGRDTDSDERNINDVFTCRGKDLTSEFLLSCIQNTEYENIDIIKSEDTFSFTVEKITYDTSRVQQKILDKALSLIKMIYDFIIIDCSPYFNIITSNVLCASDYVITPIESDGFSYKGLVKLLERIEDIQEELNPSLTFLGIFMTKADPRTIVFKDLCEEYTSVLGNKFLQNYIRYDNKVRESSTRFVPLLHYTPECRAAQDYRKLLLHLNILDSVSEKQLEKIWTSIEK